MQFIKLFIVLFCIYTWSASSTAAKIELEFKGQKQVVEFDPKNPKDFERAEKLWMKADYKKYYVYSATGTFRVFNEPREDAKFIEIGNWHQELNTARISSPYLAEYQYDKEKWHPRFSSKNPGWLKLDDPYIVWPHQLKPVTSWPIRYITLYRGTDTGETEAGITPKHDEYVRWHYDREGFLLNNRTMQRYIFDGAYWRIFRFGDLVQQVAVSKLDAITKIYPDGGPSETFDLKQMLAKPKQSYRESTPVSDRGGGDIFVWATFDDPVKPVYDKFNPKICIVDCLNRKRWASEPGM